MNGSGVYSSYNANCAPTEGTRGKKTNTNFPKHSEETIEHVMVVWEAVASILRAQNPTLVPVDGDSTLVFSERISDAFFIPA